MYKRQALVPALIGLFAVPQIIDLMADSHVLLEKLTCKPQKGMLRQVIKAHRRYLRTLGIGSLIGTIIGVIPGAGGQVAGLMSYDQTKKFDKNPDRFGTGDPEGVCAAESANNATVAPAMIPLLTLSIPGSPTAAVLLGGLLIHGLFPGPDLFTEKADITYTFISGCLLYTSRRRRNASCVLLPGVNRARASAMNRSPSRRSVRYSPMRSALRSHSR